MMGYTLFYDCTQLFEHEIFQPLKDPLLFNQVYLHYGTVTWNDDLGVSSDEFYINGIVIDPREAELLKNPKLMADIELGLQQSIEGKVVSLTESFDEDEQI